MTNGKDMTSMNLNALRAGTLLAVLAAATCCIGSSMLYAAQAKTATAASQSQQTTFDTPQQAADAMMAAVKSDDVATLQKIFGPAGHDFVSTGDDVQDKNSRTDLAALAQQKMQVDIDPQNPNRAIISMGAEDWPMPVPIVKQNGKWHFDSRAGRNEIVNRRIGSNELDAITICRGFVEAQKDYAEQIHDNSGVNQYAQKIVSSPGKQDGLAWQNPDGSWGGPVGEAIAKAIAEGYSDKAKPVHGYYFKVLKGQGPDAPLGRMNYVIDGAMIGGFALVATPAQYRVTGVMTFMVGYDGVVFEKDMGPDSLKLFEKMELYNPDKSWQPTQADE